MRRELPRWIAPVSILVLLVACARQRGPEVHSMLGEPLRRENLPGVETPEKLRALEDARTAIAQYPDDEASWIWLGRRLGYLGRFREAIDVFSAGLRRHPGSYRLLRHRGHRYISCRDLDRAVADLSLAARLADGHADVAEPDGAPNPSGVARSTDRSNIYYHLGLAHYLRGEYERADRAFAVRDGLESPNDDMVVSTTHWRYLALRRLGRDVDAGALVSRVHEGMHVLENSGYHDLCLMYAGRLSPRTVLSRATEGGSRDHSVEYGVAAYWMLSGEEARAREMLGALVASPSWHSFGVIAAECDLAREDPRRGRARLP
ncbi:MAG: tetratricopeptide repeat protein [Phycisphaerales bacterium]